jgi:hypothetical protein
MVDKWQLSWFEPARYWETLTEWLTTPEAVLARLDELESRFWVGEQLCVSPRVRADNGEELCIGLAGDHWLLEHVGTGDCEFSWAIGDPEAEGTLWVYSPADTEVSRKRLVPRAAAERAVREWLESKTLGGGLVWTDDYRAVY